MLHGSSSPGVAGSELTRLLARLADTTPADTRPAFAERLGHWLDWTGAIALSTVLSDGWTGAAPAADVPGARSSDEATFQRVRVELEASIAAGHGEAIASPSDFGPHRRHCGACQQQMQLAVAALRQRLRDTLSRRSPAMARLAAIDAVMEQALAPHERSLLGLVPLRLQAHFGRLQRDADAAEARAAGAAAQAQPQAAHARWAASFGADMARLLRAELAHRLLPAQGLLDALLTRQPT